MSGRIGHIIIITAEEDGKCELCGAIDELRPYGPKGERICFDCGQKDKEGTERRMGAILFGDTAPGGTA
jgi:hypothetical protein